MLTEHDLTLNDMRRYEHDDYRCAECNGRLVVVWLGGWILRCVNDLSHRGVTSHDLEREQLKATERKERHMDTVALTKMTETQMTERVNMAKFPQELTQPERRLLVAVARSYGLDPLMGEIIPYQGRPFVNIDGRYRKAQETGELDGVETRPATKQERADWNIPDEDYFFRADVWRKGASHPFVGWGRVRAVETQVRKDKPGDAKKPIVTNPQRVAEKRAEAQGLRKGFHLPLPSAEDIGTPEQDEPNIPDGKIIDVKSSPAAEKKAPEKTDVNRPSTEAERRRLFAVAKQQNIPDAELKKYIDHHYDVNTSAGLTSGDVAAIVKAIETGTFKYVTDDEQPELFGEEEAEPMKR